MIVKWFSPLFTGRLSVQPPLASAVPVRRAWPASPVSAVVAVMAALGVPPPRKVTKSSPGCSWRMAGPLRVISGFCVKRTSCRPT